MTWFMLPAGLALLFKLVIIFLARGSSRSSLFFIGLVTVFAVHNIAEISLFLQFNSGTTADFVMRCFYTTATFVLAYLLCFSVEVSCLFTTRSNIVYAITIGIAFILTTLTFASDLVIAGSHPLLYSLTAIKGDYYWLFQLFVLSSTILVIAALVTGYFKAKTHKDEIRCLLVLLSTAPIILTASAIIILMAIGYSVNAIVIIPIASTFFLAFMLRCESKHRLTDIRRFIPFSIENRISNAIQHAIYRYSTEETNYKETKSELEKLLVLYKHIKNGESITSTAKSMSVPRSTVYSIFKKHDIPLPQDLER